MAEPADGNILAQPLDKEKEHQTDLSLAIFGKYGRMYVVGRSELQLQHQRLPGLAETGQSFFVQTLLRRIKQSLGRAWNVQAKALSDNVSIF